LLLSGLWVRGQGVSLAHHILGSVITVSFGWHFVAKGRVRAPGVVKIDLFTDYAFSDKAEGQPMQIDCFVF